MDTEYQKVHDLFEEWIGSKPIPAHTYGPDYLPVTCVLGHVAVGVFLAEHPEYDAYRETLLHEFAAVWFMVGTQKWKDAKEHAFIV